MQQYINIDKYFNCLLKTHPQYKKQIDNIVEHNATVLCCQVNYLLNDIFSAVKLFDSVVINSGWRPLEYNAMIGGAKNSYHCKAMAVDIQDKSSTLSNYLLDREDLLEKYHLRMEHPSSTPGWCHLDLGKVLYNRIFITSPDNRHKPIKNRILQKRNLKNNTFVCEFFNDLIEFFIK